MRTIRLPPQFPSRLLSYGPTVLCSPTMIDVVGVRQKGIKVYHITVISVRMDGRQFPRASTGKYSITERWCAQCRSVLPVHQAWNPAEITNKRVSRDSQILHFLHKIIRVITPEHTFGRDNHPGRRGNCRAASSAATELSLGPVRRDLSRSYSDDF